MPVTINGTTGIAGVDGSASTPAVQGSDTNTGMFFPAADTIAFTTNGTEDMRIDSSGNVGVGTTSPGAKLDVTSATGGNAIISRALDGSVSVLRALNTSGNYGWFVPNTTNAFAVYDYAANAERMRIDSSGNLLVGTTSNTYAARINVTGGANRAINCLVNTTANSVIQSFENPNGVVGAIYTNGSATTYSTSSDYRLKHDVQPISDGITKVLAIKPVTYKWNVDDSYGEGFIAHELAEHIPLAVTGEKDAVDEEGNIKPQGVDYSKIVVHLVAAIQELSAKVDAQAAEIAALKANAPA